MMASVPMPLIATAMPAPATVSGAPRSGTDRTNNPGTPAAIATATPPREASPRTGDCLFLLNGGVECPLAATALESSSVGGTIRNIWSPADPLPPWEMIRPSGGTDWTRSWLDSPSRDVPATTWNTHTRQDYELTFHNQEESAHQHHQARATDSVASSPQQETPPGDSRHARLDSDVQSGSPSKSNTATALSSDNRDSKSVNVMTDAEGSGVVVIGVEHILSKVQQWTVTVFVHPLWVLYLRGPKVIGGWQGQSLGHICAALAPGTDARFWEGGVDAQLECTAMVRAHFDSVFLMAVVFLWYLLVLVALISAIVVACNVGPRAITWSIRTLAMSLWLLCTCTCRCSSLKRYIVPGTMPPPRRVQSRRHQQRRTQRRRRRRQRPRQQQGGQWQRHMLLDGNNVPFRLGNVPPDCHMAQENRETRTRCTASQCSRSSSSSSNIIRFHSRSPRYDNSIGNESGSLFRARTERRGVPGIQVAARRERGTNGTAARGNCRQSHESRTEAEATDSATPTFILDPRGASYDSVTDQELDSNDCGWFEPDRVHSLPKEEETAWVEANASLSATEKDDVRDVAPFVVSAVQTSSSVSSFFSGLTSPASTP